MSVDRNDTSAEALALLQRIGAAADGEIDLAGGALALAALDRPQVPLERYRAHLAELAADLAAATAGADTPQARAAALGSVIYGQHGYSGDSATYDDLQNANLMRVIDRRKGLPVALGILVLHAGRAQGWLMAGLNFPGHFVVRLEGGAERLILDPFAGARPLGPADLRLRLKSAIGEGAELRPDYYEPAGNRAILLRLANNVKLRLVKESKLEEAAAVIARMQAIAPDEAALWREAGLIQAHLGHLKRAIGLIETFREKSEGAAQQREAAQLLQELAARLH